MPQPQTLEHLCHEIIQMEVSSRIRAIEMILHSLEQSMPDATPTSQQRGRLSELKGIGKGTWEGIDIDQFIREERDSWDSLVPKRPSDPIPTAYRLPEPENALTLAELAGSWDDDRPAEEIIRDLRMSRTRNREVNL